ncbi:28S ribosomal protein S34, mitochondrial [Frankliniella fusca]|uniref:28S ribosomal protein S34, mitochondrial n=1 Tax=Frankliniella fusca TaxID=407009 RepID=A0AAE1LGP5_9NEOP|nr:28S ribosomal protein S34, mitochondrial [Frankliniella fusca]
MPYEIYGKATRWCGKPLWEILGNLKNHGVGRIIIRNETKLDYKEPSWYRVLKVQAIPPEGKVQVLPPVVDMGEVRRVRALVDVVLAGTYRGQEWLSTDTYISDFRLIPKEEEEIFTKVKKGELPPKFVDPNIFPTTAAFPPLLKELIIQDMKNRGTFTGEEPLLPMKYAYPVRVAQEGEIPTVDMSLGLGKTASPRLYANIKKT